MTFVDIIIDKFGLLLYFSVNFQPCQKSLRVL